MMFFSLKKREGPNNIRVVAMMFFRTLFGPQHCCGGPGTRNKKVSDGVSIWKRSSILKTNVS